MKCYTWKLSKNLFYFKDQLDSRALLDQQDFPEDQVFRGYVVHQDQQEMSDLLDSPDCKEIPVLQEDLALQVPRVNKDPRD